MKTIHLKLFGIIALVAIIGFTLAGCDDAITDALPTVSKVTVRGDTVIEKGQTKTYTAQVEGSSLLGSHKLVTWTIDEENSIATGTSISDDGELTVDANETVATLTVRATSMWNTTKSGTLAVTVYAAGGSPTVSNVAITPATATVAKGGTETFSATVTGTNLENAQKTVTWSVEGTNNTGTTINSSGVLTVAANESSTRLTVRATSTVDVSKRGIATVTVTGVTEPPDPLLNGKWELGFIIGYECSFDNGEYVWNMMNTKGFYTTNKGILTMTPTHFFTQTDPDDPTTSGWYTKDEYRAIIEEAAAAMSKEELQALLDASDFDDLDEYLEVTIELIIGTYFKVQTYTYSFSDDDTLALFSGEYTITYKRKTTGVKVFPTYAWVVYGETLSFSAIVAIGEDDSTQGVTWSIDESDIAAGTSISPEGVLTVDASETLTELTVRATSKEDTSLSGTVTVRMNAKGKVSTPTADPIAGLVIIGAEVTLEVKDWLSGVTIYYTTDGSEPAASSAEYTAPITINETTTIKAIAVYSDDTYLDSEVLTATYTIAQVITPTATPEAGGVAADTTVTLASATPDATIYYTTDGSEPTESSAEYSDPIAIEEAMTIKAFAVKTGFKDSEVLTAAYTIAVSGVTLDKNSLSLSTDAEETLSATVEPANATNKSLTWKSSDEDVATVADGVVSSHAEGTAVITVTTADGSYTETCEVRVENKMTVTNEIGGTTLLAKLQWLSENARSGTEYTLPVSANESLAPQTLSYEGKTNVTVILIGDTSIRNLSLSANGSLFTVPSDVTLILENNITLTGRNGNSSSLVQVSGRLIMKNGAKITGNTNNNGVYGKGGGVLVLVNGTFTMDGGIITNNNSSVTGGGVDVNGTFTMNGGEISGNNSATSQSGGGGGVFVNGTFTMNNGKISGNKCGGSAPTVFGGGVFVGGTTIQRGTFTMNGGEISGNTAGVATIPNSNGGGVAINSSDSFTMNGGIIYGNKVINSNIKDPNGYSLSNSGGGVYNRGNDSNTIHIAGGTIYGNETSVTTANRNTATSGAALYGPAQRGTFNGTIWTSKGTLNTRNTTITVVNGVLQ